MISCEFLSRSICKDLLNSSYFKIKFAVFWPHRALCSVCSVVCTVTRHGSFHVLVYFPEYLSHFMTTHLELLVSAIASWSIACVPWWMGGVLLILCACDALLSVLPLLRPLHSTHALLGWLVVSTSLWCKAWVCPWSWFCPIPQMSHRQRHP